VKGVARKLAVDSLAFIDTRAAAEALISLAVADSAVDDQATWWLKNRSEGEWSAMNLDPVLRDQGITNKPAELVSITVPAKPKEVKFTVAEVLKLKGDAVKGKQLAPRTSHLAPRTSHLAPRTSLRDVPSDRRAGRGVWTCAQRFRKTQTPDVLARSIVDPSSEISHGFDGDSIQLENGEWIDGLVLTEGKTVTIRSTGGVTQDVPKGEIKSRKQMDRSLMLSADQLGLSAQDVADIVEWMRGY